MEKVDHKTRKITETYVNNRGVTKTRTINETYTETNTYYYHKNHLNSIVAITDNLGNILEEYEYDVFGKPYSKDLNTGKVTNLKASTIGNTRLFTGREYERGLQLYYNRARYYNPELGRFISRDPIDISDDVNLYSYVGNSPVSYFDPMGLAKSMTADEFRIAFVSAYDDYLFTKGRLQSNLNTYYAGQKIAGNNPYKNAENQFLSLREELRQKEEIAKQMHYDRNIYNDVPDDMNIDNAENKYGRYQPSPLFSTYLGSYYHQDPNIEGTELKFVSKDGLNEVIFSENSEIILSDGYMGTYNFFSPKNKIKHIRYDVDPYNLWGNTLYDNVYNK